MPFKSLCLLSFFSLWAFIGHSQAQIDSAAAITAFPKQDWFSETPFFCPFDPNYLLLDGRVFHISKRRFLSPDSTYVNTCYPTGASIEQYTPDPEAEPRYHWWEPDPEATDYYWAADEGNDTLVLWRYDRRTDRQDSFLITSVNHHGFEIAWGKPGIWVSDHWNLMLLDRHSGAVLRRIERPDRDSGSFVSLYPWGDSVLVNKHWLYQPNSNSYKIFSPLSSDLKECNAPGNVEFKGTVCGSMVQEENDYTYYLTSPYSPSIRLPFDLGCCAHDYLLAVNPPFVWFRLPEKLMSINYETGDSVVYPGPTGYRLNGNQDGRFLGFLEPRGLIFFDKANCQFRILDLPYGYKQPRYFTSDQRYIYLTYEDRWEIVDFSHLSLAFRRSSVLEEYQQFEQDWTNLRKDQPEAFYVQYRIYLQLLDRYRNTRNPKIIETWPRLKGSIHDALFSASDSLMERIAVEYASRQSYPVSFRQHRRVDPGAG